MGFTLALSTVAVRKLWQGAHVVHLARLRIGLVAFDVELAEAGGALGDGGEEAAAEGLVGVVVAVFNTITHQVPKINSIFNQNYIF